MGFGLRVTAHLYIVAILIFELEFELDMGVQHAHK